MKGIADLMQIDPDDDLLQLVLERSSINSMRCIASKLNPSPTNYVGKVVQQFGSETRRYAQRMKHGKMRRGVAGDGKKSLPEEILRALEAEWRHRITPVLGYRSYAEMRESCSFLNK